MSSFKRNTQYLESEGHISPYSTIRGKRFGLFFKSGHGEVKPPKTGRKRDKFRSFINYYLPQMSPSSNSSDSATLVPSECKDDEKYAKLTHDTSAEPLAAKDNENDSAPSTLGTRDVSRRHTLFHKLRKNKPGPSVVPDDSIRTNFSFANSIQFTRKKSSPIFKQDEKQPGRSSLRQKIRSRLAMKTKPIEPEISHSLFISPDIVSTIKDCVLNENSVPSNADKESTIDLDLDVEKTDSSHTLSTKDHTNKFVPIYPHGYPVVTPPKELPPDQHAKWKRRQLLKQTANSFDHEKWKSRQSLLLRENSTDTNNFSPLGSKTEDMKASPINIFENVSKFFNSSNNLKENLDTSFDTSKESESRFHVKSSVTPSSIDPNSFANRQRSHSINSFTKTAHPNNLRRVLTVGDSRFGDSVWSGNSDPPNDKNFKGYIRKNPRDSWEESNDPDFNF